MRYVDAQDGTPFAGADEKAVVRAMKRAAWMEPYGKKEYMRETAERCALVLPGSNVDPSSAKSFLASLVRAGFLERRVR